MRRTLLALLVLYIIDIAFFHGDVTAQLISTGQRLTNGKMVAPLR